MVAHFHGQLPAAPALGLGSGRHGHGRAAVAQCVGDEVGDDDVEAAAVQPHGQPGGDVGAHVRPAPRPQAPADRGGDVRLVGDESKSLTDTKAGTPSAYSSLARLNVSSATVPALNTSLPGVEARSPGCVAICGDPLLRGLRAHPGWASVLEAIGRT